MFKRWNKLTLAVLAVFIGCWCEAAQAEVCLMSDQEKCEDAVMPDLSKEAGKDVCRGIKEHREGSAWECKQCNGAEWCYCPDDMEIVGKDCIYTPHNDKCGQLYQFTSNLKETKKNPEYDSLWECKLCEDKNSQYNNMYKCDCPAVFDIIDYSCEKERCGTDYSHVGGCPGRGYEEDQCAQRASLWFKKWKCYCDPSTKRITKKKDCLLKCASGEYEEKSDCERNAGEGEDCQQNSVTECYYIHDNCPGYNDTTPKSSSWDCSNAQCQSYARYDNSKCTAKDCPSGEYTYSTCNSKKGSKDSCVATSNYSGDSRCYKIDTWVEPCPGYTYSTEQYTSSGSSCCSKCTDSSSDNYGKYSCTCTTPAVDSCANYNFTSSQCDGYGKPCCTQCTDSSSSNYGKYLCDCKATSPCKDDSGSGGDDGGSCGREYDLDKKPTIGDCSVCSSDSKYKCNSGQYTKFGTTGQYVCYDSSHPCHMMNYSNCESNQTAPSKYIDPSESCPSGAPKKVGPITLFNDSAFRDTVFYQMQCYHCEKETTNSCTASTYTATITCTSSGTAEYHSDCPGQHGVGLFSCSFNVPSCAFSKAGVYNSSGSALYEYGAGTGSVTVASCKLNGTCKFFVSGGTLKGTASLSSNGNGTWSCSYSKGAGQN